MNRSDLHRKAKEPKAILGDTGTIGRVAAFAVVYRGFVHEDDWVVESADSHGKDGMFLTVFMGPEARERALDFLSHQ